MNAQGELRLHFGHMTESMFYSCCDLYYHKSMIQKAATVCTDGQLIKPRDTHSFTWNRAPQAKYSLKLQIMFTALKITIDVEAMLFQIAV